jgi:hypothetical protein
MPIAPADLVHDASSGRIDEGRTVQKSWRMLSPWKSRRAEIRQEETRVSS